MADVATISLRVNTGELEKGSQELDKFAGKAGQAALSAGKLNDSQRASFKAFMESASSVSETHRRISEFKARLQETEQSQKKVTKSTTEQRQELQALLQKISPVNKALEDLDSIQSTLSRFSGKGMLASEQFQRYNAILEENRSKLLRVQDAETAEGRAILSAEAALKSQERARTAFIQKLKDQVATQNLSRTELLRYRAEQLGAGSAADVYIRKLKDSAAATHGLGLASAGARREIGILIGEVARGNLGALRGSGITLANRAGWIEQLMTLKGLGIATVVGGIAAAVYGLGKAWYEGSQESVEFNKQLILTGNYAGKTSGQLQALARSLSGNGVTQHAMAGVLAQVVGSGAFSGNDVSMVSSVAARLQQATGQAVDETINQFKRLKDDPVNAVATLNDSLHFLTATQYEQIASAQSMGDTQKAAELAMRAYSEAVIQRAGAVEDNLGSLEKAWDWVKNAASGAWDAMLGVGRNPDTAMKRQGSFAEWQAAEKEYRALSKNLKVDPDYAGNNPLQKADAERLRNARQQVDIKKQAYDLADQQYAQEGLAAAREKMRTDQQSQAIRNQQQFNQLVETGTTAAEKRALQEKKLNQLIEKNRQDAKDGIATLWTDKDIATARAGIEKEWKDPKTPKGKAYTPSAGVRAEDSAQADLIALQAQLQTLKEHKSVNDVISQQRKELWTVQAKITVLQQAQDGPLKRQLSAQEKSILASSRQTLSLKEQLAVLGDQITAQEQLNKRMDTAQKYVTQMGEKGEALDSASAVSSRLASQQATLAQLKIGWKNSGGSLEDAGYKQQEDAAKRYFAKEEELRGNWRVGIQRGFAEYADEATDVYGQVSRITQGAFSGMSASLTDFLVSGKNSFNDFLTSTLKGITQMTTQMALLNSMKYAFGGTAVGDFFGIKQAWNGGYIPEFSSGGYTGNGGKYEPKGVVHGGEFVFTKAQTEAFGVGHLTALARSAGKMPGYANGGFVSGNAPMANIPALRPGYSSGGSSVTVSMGDVVISGGSQQQPSGKAPAGDSIMKQLKPAIVTTISEQANKPGTPLWNAINGKR